MLLCKRRPVYYDRSNLFNATTACRTLWVQVKTLQHWRWRTRKGKDYGPKWEEIPPQPLRKKFMTIRYNFDNVLAWEKENNIDPITPFNYGI